MTQNIKQFTVKGLRELLKPYYKKVKATKKLDLYNMYITLIRNKKNAEIIQKYWRRYFIKSYISTIGPALYNRSLCNNVEDFMTMDDLSQLDIYEFISYIGSDGFIYGFSILSLPLLIKKNNQNPYNRTTIEDSVKKQVYKKIRYNRILNKIVPNNISENRINDFVYFFQKLDSLGNYTNVEWITSLSNKNMKLFILELQDIWNYRASLTRETKQLLCPQGDPFDNIPLKNISKKNKIIDTLTLKTYIYTIVNKIVNDDATRENQILGGMYVLTAITLVNYEAALSMPWLHSTVI